jgi:hypothetical protein
MVLQPIQKPTWRTGLIKRMRRIPAKDRQDLIFVVFLFLLQVSLAVAGMIYAS